MDAPSSRLADAQVSELSFDGLVYIDIVLDSEASWPEQAEQSVRAPRQQLRMIIRGLEADVDLN